MMIEPLVYPDATDGLFYPIFNTLYMFKYVNICDNIHTFSWNFDLSKFNLKIHKEIPINDFIADWIFFSLCQQNLKLPTPTLQGVILICMVNFSYR